MSNGKTIVVANQKGGVAKTTSALELCTCLSKLGKKVILLDFDQQCDCTSSLVPKGDATAEENTIYDLFTDGCTLPDAIRHGEDFDYICGSPSVSRIEKIFSLDEDYENIYLLHDICEALSEIYDYVFVDTNPHRNLVLNMAYVAADYVLIPSDSSRYSLDGIEQIKDDIAKYRDGRNSYSHARIIGLILTRTRKTVVSQGAKELLQTIAADLGEDVFVDSVSISSKAEESTYKLGSMQHNDYYGNAAKDYRRIARKLNDLVEKEIEGVA